MKSKLIRYENVDWSEVPDHVGALSKYIVGPNGVSKSNLIDFRTSVYQPGGYVKLHAHSEIEHIYYGLDGVGIVLLDGEKHVIEPETTIHIKPNVKHSIINTDNKPLVLIVISVPPLIYKK